MILMRLELNVVYEQNGVHEKELANFLSGLVEMCMSEGLLTRDTPAEVDSLTYVIRAADTSTNQQSILSKGFREVSISESNEKMGNREALETVLDLAKHADTFGYNRKAIQVMEKFKHLLHPEKKP